MSKVKTVKTRVNDCLAERQHNLSLEIGVPELKGREASELLPEAHQ